MKYLILIVFLFCNVTLAHDLPDLEKRRLEIQYADEYQLIELIDSMNEEMDKIGCDKDSLIFTYSFMMSDSKIHNLYTHTKYKLEACTEAVDE